jgi:hypothetical protein
MPGPKLDPKKTADFIKGFKKKTEEGGTDMNGESFTDKIGRVAKQLLGKSSVSDELLKKKADDEI